MTRQSQAVALVNAVLGPVTDTSNAFVEATPDSRSGEQTSTDVTTPDVTSPPILPPVLEVLPPPSGPTADISGATIPLGPGEQLRTFSGSTTLTGSQPALSIAGSTIGGSQAGTLLEIASGASLALEGPLLTSSTAH